jgi:hypothetical protein
MKVEPARTGARATSVRSSGSMRFLYVLIA